MWTLQDAKNKFSAVVDAAMAGTPQEVTRRGKPAVVVISAEEFARLNAVAKGTARLSFVEHLLSMPVPPYDDGEELFPRIEMRPRDIEI